MVLGTVGSLGFRGMLADRLQELRTFEGHGHLVADRPHQGQLVSGERGLAPGAEGQGAEQLLAADQRIAGIRIDPQGAEGFQASVGALQNAARDHRLAFLSGEAALGHP